MISVLEDFGSGVLIELQTLKEFVIYYLSFEHKGSDVIYAFDYILTLLFCVS